MLEEKIFIKNIAAFRNESEKRYKALLPDLKKSTEWQTIVEESILGESIRLGDYGTASTLSTEYYFRRRTHQMASIAVILNMFNGNDYIILQILKDLYSRNPGVFSKNANDFEITKKIFFALFKAYSKKFNIQYESMPSYGADVSFDTKAKNNSIFKWPGEISNTELQFKSLLLDSFYKINGKKTELISKYKFEDVVTSFGSCFAVNLNRVLVEKGINSNVVQINEQFNNTFAVSEIISKVIKIDEQNTEIGIRIRKTKLAVVTLGVSTMFVDKESGSQYTKRDISNKIIDGVVVQKMLTVEDSINLLNNITSDLSKYCETVVFSLSPVPLIRTTNKNSNILLDDIESKLNLRNAIIDVCSKRDNLYYWPSFEIIKWFGAHFGTFGKTDKDTRHVNDDIVEIIVSNFIEIFFENEKSISNENNN